MAELVPGLLTRRAAPCDDCVHAKTCAGAALACNAYIRFIDGRDWTMTLRIPTPKATRLVAAADREQKRQDAREERRLGRRVAP
jgi:hypothetical protein